MRKILLCAAAGILLASALQAQPLRLLVGTLTDEEDCPGAFLMRFDPADGSNAQLASARMRNPTFITLSADGSRAWSVCEYSDGRQGVYACALGEETLELQGFQSSSPEGNISGNPCNILFLNGFILTANYTGGSVSVFPIEEDGSLGPLCRTFSFGEKSRMHCCTLSPDGRWLFASDLGCDAIRRFPVTASEDLPVGEPDIAFQATPGSGPRHFIFSADGRFCYLLGELGDTLTVLRYEDGTLTPVQELKAYRGRGKGSADIHLSPDGRFLYTSHRLRRDGIAIFKVNPESGRVRRVAYRRTGTHPRNFTLSPDGRWLLCACRDADAVEVYRRNMTTGRLRRVPARTVRIPRPMFVQLF